MTTEQLKECPFCGSAPERITRGNSKGRVRCGGTRKDGVWCRIAKLTWPIDSWQNRPTLDPEKMRDKAEIESLRNYYLPQLRFNVDKNREYAIKHNAPEFHQAANAYEVAVGCIEEALGFKRAGRKKIEAIDPEKMREEFEGQTGQKNLKGKYIAGVWIYADTITDAIWQGWKLAHKSYAARPSESAIREQVRREVVEECAAFVETNAVWQVHGEGWKIEPIDKTDVGANYRFLAECIRALADKPAEREG